jgi:protein-S-isoprenylcysteine O-methyltransferase Ste14
MNLKGIKWYHVHGLHSLLVIFLFIFYSSPVYANQRYAPWAFVVLPAAIYMLFFGWLRVKWAMEKGASCRKYPYYLMLALLLRRLPGRKCRPAFGTYWRHKLIRYRWMLLFIKSYYLPLCVGSIYYRVAEIYLEPMNTAGVALFILEAEYLTMLVSAVIATAGYSIENPRWGYPIKAVETNIFGLLFCLMCYPPLRELIPAKVITGDFFERYRIIAEGSFWDHFLRGGMVLFMVFHVYAILVQGLRFANLTYRGTVTKGPYAFIRHPQYITKILWFLFAWLPFFGSPRNIICFVGWAAIYVGRTVTEDRFLRRFPDYREYAARVKYKYIPRVMSGYPRRQVTVCL